VKIVRALKISFPFLILFSLAHSITDNLLKQDVTVDQPNKKRTIFRL